MPSPTLGEGANDRSNDNRSVLRLLLRDIPRAAIGVIILLAIAINFANIVGRYVFLAPLPWAEEVLVFLVIWGVCLGASAVTYDNRHLDMDLFAARVPAEAARCAGSREARGAGRLLRFHRRQRLDHRRASWRATARSASPPAFR